MMADDSDDDKPLLFQFKNSKASVQAKCSTKHGVSSSLQKTIVKPSKFPESSDDDEPLEPLGTSSQKTGVLHDETPSPPESLHNSSAARIFAQKPASVKVYTKRKKQSDNGNMDPKKLKSSGVGSNDGMNSVLTIRSIEQSKENNATCKSVNAGNIDIDGCREREANVDAFDSGNIPIADFEGRNHDDSNGGTHAELESKKKSLMDDRRTKLDDPRFLCTVAQTQSLSSHAAIRMGSVKAEEDDDDLLLSKVSRSKKGEGSATKDMKTLSNKHKSKEEGSDILIKEEEEDDNLPLSKMSRPPKYKVSSVSGKQAGTKHSAAKGVGHYTTQSKHVDTKEKKQPAEKEADVSANNTRTSAKKQKDWLKDEQQCLPKEEEDDDHLPLGQMSCLKKRKSSFSPEMSGGEDKDEKESRRNSDNIGTAQKKKFLNEGVANNSAKSSENKIDNRIPCADGVSLCSPSCTKNRNIADVTNEISGKGTDVRAGLVCKSRAKQLLALSKLLEDTGSEEEERGEVDDNDNDDDDDDDDDEDDEDEDEDEVEDRDGLKAAKRTSVKSKRRKKTPSSALKVKASVRSKMLLEDEDYGDDEDEEEEEEDNISEEEDYEWEDDEEYNFTRSTKRKKKVVASSKVVKGRQSRKMVKKMEGVPGAGGGQKWTTLEHNGVIFPPFYQPHGVKMLYEGKPVDLTPEEEEVATMFAVMKETDYASKNKFLANFWHDWKKILGPNHIIQTLEDCDFTPIYEWHLAEKEKKKQLSSQAKKAIKEEKLKQEENYMWAVVDGVKEKVGNFRVEPPGLFRGRGEHPKMGKLKRRIYPEDIVINIGANSPIPECPLPGHRWKEVRHDDTVTWLAYWNDPINTKEQKYVFLSPSSSLKGQSDKEKYEKARVLKDYIEDIRKTYTENFTSSDPTSRQIAVATYLIDQLALRAGNEKDDDEADTVGCCSLKVEHVTLIPPSSLQFDFLGKDSIRYFNVVEVVRPVYEAVGDFKKDKDVGIDLFDRLDTSKLNAHLKNIMPQLTAKVFRTYNASITLDNLLVETDGHLMAEKVAAYQRANKEVAILCNHQRSVSKSHGAQMEKLEGKLAELSDLVHELQKDLERARKGKPPLNDSDGNVKKHQNPDVLEKKISQTNQKIERMKLEMTIKEDLKTVALGTSKINYMDPRITVAWCKQHEVPIEKIFNKSLLGKFAWAMDVETSFHF